MLLIRPLLDASYNDDRRTTRSVKKLLTVFHMGNIEVLLIKVFLHEKIVSSATKSCFSKYKIFFKSNSSSRFDVVDDNGKRRKNTHGGSLPINWPWYFLTVSKP